MPETLKFTEPTPASPADPEYTANGHSQEDWVEVVRQRLRGLRYGAVQILVHDGRVTQVECTEKVRFEGAGTRPRVNGASGAAAVTPSASRQ